MNARRVRVSRFISKASFAVLLVGVLSVRKASPASQPQTTCILFPLENNSGKSSLSWIGEGLALSIAEQISAQGMQVIPREVRLDLIEDADLPSNASLSRASMISVGQRAGVDILLYGSYSGSEAALSIVLQFLDLRVLKLGREFTATRPLRNLPDLENDLSWEVLRETGFVETVARERHRERKRSIPNGAYSLYIRSLSARSEEDQIQLLSRAVEMYPDYPAALFRLGQHYYRKGECARAVSRLEGALKIPLVLLEAQFMIGTCYLKEGNTGKAIRTYSSLLPFEPPVAVLNNLGVAYLREGDYPQAADSFRRARARARTDATLSVNLAILRIMEGDRQAALSVLEESLRANPGHGLLHYLRSRALREGGSTESAERSLAQAKRLGVDAEKLRNQDPGEWTQVFTSWVNPK